MNQLMSDELRGETTSRVLVITLSMADARSIVRRAPSSGLLLIDDKTARRVEEHIIQPTANTGTPVVQF